MHELYIYYRVSAAQASQACDEVHALQAELRERYPGLVARCVQRADAVDAPPDASPGAAVQQTWMEIYTHPSGLSDDEVAAIVQHGAAAVRSIASPRHPEVFGPCA